MHGRTSRTELAAAFAAVIDSMSHVEMRKSTPASERVDEIDVWCQPTAIDELERHLTGHGTTAVRSVHEGAHRFFLAHSHDGWSKVDVKLRPPKARRIRNLVWLLRRRRGPVIALLGADGAGKSSTIERFVETAPFGAASVYLGFRSRRRRATPAGTDDRADPPAAPPALRQIVGVAVWTLRMLRRLTAVHLLARRGPVVLCDRHPIESLVMDSTPSPLARSLRRFAARRLLPAPDRLILLAAPGDVLFARKGEHSPERLDEMTSAYRGLLDRMSGTEVDATGSPDTVLAEVESVIFDALIDRHA